jgi:hypothetical protein
MSAGKDREVAIDLTARDVLAHAQLALSVSKKSTE